MSYRQETSTDSAGRRSANLFLYVVCVRKCTVSDCIDSKTLSLSQTRVSHTSEFPQNYHSTRTLLKTENNDKFSLLNDTIVRYFVPVNKISILLTSRQTITSNSTKVWLVKTELSEAIQATHINQVALKRTVVRPAVEVPGNVYISSATSRT